MFVILDGTMGSGKTYYAVDYIYNNLQKYYKIFTNINNFKFHYNIEKLDFDAFTDVLFAVREVHYDKIQSDNDFYQILIDYGISDPSIISNIDEAKPSLFIIDESQRYFSKTSDIHNFFIQYSRHMNIHIILITQSYKILHRDLPSLCDFLLHAVSSSKRLSDKTFRYQKYVGTPFYKDTFDSSLTLTFDSRIGSLYSSGGGVGVKSVILKHLWKFVLLVVFVVIAFSYFVYSNYFVSTRTSSTQKISKSINKQKKFNVVVEPKSINLSNFTLIKFTCINTKCNYLSVSLSPVDLDNLITYSASQILSKNRIDDNIFIINLLASSSFLRVLNLDQGVKNEKNIVSFDSFVK